jgi:hypothetical protein
MNKRYWVLIAVGLLVSAAVIADGPLNGGDPNCDGTNDISDLTYYVDYMFAGGPAPCDFAPGTTPVAMGTVNSAGDLVEGMGISDVIWNGSYRRYEITITGETYLSTNYATSVTVISDLSLLMSTSSSGDGKLYVYIWNISGHVPGSFQFVTFKLI